jgi:hypothetical protein
MIRHGFDVGFFSSPDEGHYSCICSRCLSNITKGQATVRILAELTPTECQEFRYCEACQKAAGEPLQTERDPHLERWRASEGSHPRFQLSPAEIRGFVRRIKTERTNVLKGHMNPWRTDQGGEVRLRTKRKLSSAGLGSESPPRGPAR